MRLILPLVGLLCRYATLVSSTPPYPLLGLGYPPPTDLSSNGSLVYSAWSNFTAQMESYMRSNTTVEGLVPNLGSYTISVGAFSIHDPQAAETLQYHHTGADVKNSDTGDKQVNCDSVYRVASITKLFTVYLTLVSIGSEYWERPLTDFIPELAAYADATPPDPINVVDWKTVTLGALAGQIAGIPRDTSLLGSDILLTDPIPPIPPLPQPNVTNPADIDPCIAFLNISGINCPRAPYFSALTRRPPILPGWTSPIYTNAGYALLSLAVENITGRPFSTLMTDNLLSPLHMSSTFYDRATNLSHVVLPGGSNGSVSTSFFSAATNDAASGGVFSSTSDLAKFGLSILNSTFLTPLETRKWMKPIANTNSLDFSVGRPWEIFRMTLPTTDRVVDLYTKAGDAKGYSSYLILAPGFGVGFSILVANGKASTVLSRAVIADVLTETLIPALEAQAAKETERNFAGRYTSSSPTTGNSSLTLAIDPQNGAGLIIKQWINNNTDVFPVFAAVGGDQMSLFPTGQKMGNKVGFRGTYGTTAYKRDVGLFAKGVTADAQWEYVDTGIFAGKGVDSFIFEVDEGGRAAGVVPGATRGVLRRSG